MTLRMNPVYSLSSHYAICLPQNRATLLIFHSLLLGFPDSCMEQRFKTCILSCATKSKIKAQYYVLPCQLVKSGRPQVI